MSDLSAFSLEHMTQCLAAIRQLGKNCTSMEAAAREVISYLYEQFGEVDAARQIALARLFKMVRHADLPGELQEKVTVDPGTPLDDVVCMTLLATRGCEQAWNQRQLSRGHQVIALPSAQAVARLPMIAQLIQQLGFTIPAIVQGDRVGFVADRQEDFNVFHVERASGSTHIPAQAEFVAPYGIQSVVGFGGPLLGSELFAVILFCQVPVPRETAELFAPLTLAVKMALLPFATRDKVFERE